MIMILSVHPMTLQSYQELDLKWCLGCPTETSAGLRQNFPARPPNPALRRAATFADGHQLTTGATADDVLAASRPPSRQVTLFSMILGSTTKVLPSRQVTHPESLTTSFNR